MSLLSYLTELASNLNIADRENIKIERSVNAISNRLFYHFGSSLKGHFRFGSSTRQTMLPRRSDPFSDVDYMVVFDNSFGYSPNTYLGYLRRFAEQRYSTSEVYRSSPTIVLELEHIRFELVPAYAYYGSYYIPSPKSDTPGWILTDPFSLGAELTRLNSSYRHLLKPTIRLIKHWNAHKIFIYESYSLEKSLCQVGYYGLGRKQCFYRAVASLNTYGLSTYNANRVQSFKNSIKEVERNEEEFPDWAETTVRKLLPEI